MEKPILVLPGQVSAINRALNQPVDRYSARVHQSSKLRYSRDCAMGKDRLFIRLLAQHARVLRLEVQKQLLP